MRRTTASSLYRSLVASTHDAIESSDPTAVLLEAFRKGFDAHGTSLWHFDRQGHVFTDSVVSTLPYGDAARRSFAEHFDRLNPVLPKAAPVMRLGDVATNDDFVSLGEYRNTEFYNDYVRPNFGYFYEMGSVLEDRDGLNSMLFIARAPQQRDFNSEDRALLARLAPLVQHVIAVRKHVERLGYAFGQVSEALDLGGIIGFNSEGSVCYEHGRLLDLLISSGWISIVRGRVLTRSPLLAQQIQRSVTHALKNPQSTSGVTTAPIGAANVTMEVISAPRIHGSDSPHGVTVWLLMRGDPDSEIDLKLDRVVRQFRLTPRERDVAARVVAGDGAESVAQRLGIEVGTARVHIKALLRKTGLRRQSSFVAMVHDSVRYVRRIGRS